MWYVGGTYDFKTWGLERPLWQGNIEMQRRHHTLHESHGRAKASVGVLIGKKTSENE